MWYQISEIRHELEVESTVCAINAFDELDLYVQQGNGVKYTTAIRADMPVKYKIIANIKSEFENLLQGQYTEESE